MNWPHTSHVYINITVLVLHMGKARLEQYISSRLSWRELITIYYGAFPHVPISFRYVLKIWDRPRLAILGLTYQYTTSRISRVAYEKYHSIYYDEVFRLNPPPPQNANASAINPDDLSVRATEELRFMLFRHWTLYDAMYHSSYVAGKLGIWKERGRKRLTGLLAKMGFSIPQTQQPYSHMDIDLKSSLRSKLEAIAPEYGLLELSYPSFTRCFGYRSPPLSAADAVEAVSALLDVAGGVRMEVEVEGARNGGEWFGGGRVWEVEGRKGVVRDVLGDSDGDRARKRVTEGDEVDGADIEKIVDVPWWQKNFWTAFDALSEYVLLSFFSFHYD